MGHIQRVLDGLVHEDAQEQQDAKNGRHQADGTPLVGSATARDGAELCRSVCFHQVIPSFGSPYMGL